MKKVLFFVLLFLAINIESYSQLYYQYIDTNYLSLEAEAVAELEVGTKEVGNNRGNKVDLYNKTAGAALGSPYCASGVYYCFNTAAKTLYCKNFLKKTPSANGQFDYMAKISKRLPNNSANYITPGSLVVWKYSNSYSGHIEIVKSILNANTGHIETIGFNTSSGTSGSQRDGGGVYIRQRNIKSRLGQMLCRGLIVFGYVENNVKWKNSNCVYKMR